MLVLSRKPGERILVGEEIKITVMRIGPNSVRIGIDAPGLLKILREELASPPGNHPGQSHLPEQLKLPGQDVTCGSV